MKSSQEEPERQKPSESRDKSLSKSDSQQTNVTADVEGFSAELIGEGREEDGAKHHSHQEERLRHVRKSFIFTHQAPLEVKTEKVIFGLGTA